MNATLFRYEHPKLGLICEVIIGNVIVGNFTWAYAHKLALIFEAHFNL